ncbi:hypothetical protein DL96DRAFT_1712908 [Flagelloscypha sp. PMI_526]|nr:hypothetical protein DL96DRAFT_1712908 [Flagelloscypha sp. PMI_526]
MSSQLVFALFFATTVLAKRGGSGSATSGSSSYSSSVDLVASSHFYWTPSTLSEFLLAIIYGVLTLIGGGYWLASCYSPAMTGPGLATLRWFTWGAWGLSLLFYILAASWSGLYAHQIARYGGPGYLSIIQTSYAAFALENLATAAWLLIVLGHTYTVRRTPETENETETDHPFRPHILFYATLGFLALSFLVGVIVVPALEGTNLFRGTLKDTKIISGLYAAYTLLALIAACLLPVTILITQKRTRATEGGQSVNPLRWILLVVVPLWIITELVRYVVAIMDIVNFPYGTYLVFDPSLLLFGIASLATIVVLPFAVVKARKTKEPEASQN